MTQTHQDQTLPLDDSDSAHGDQLNSSIDRQTVRRNSPPMTLTLTDETWTSMGVSDVSSLPVTPENLTNDASLRDVARLALGEVMVPALGGIPLLAKVGQGGMGVVYFGIHTRLQCHVAVKILPIENIERSPESIPRFLREARIAAKIRSPHLTAVLDVNEENGIHFIVQEFVAGTTAGKLLKDAKSSEKVGLDEVEVLAICVAATRGLVAAHEKGVIHRDVKPDNILIPSGSAGEAWNFTGSKLADLGLARFEESDSSHSNRQNILGTPGYLSPEQADAEQATGLSSDIFSMGATLYALLSGAPPFTGASAMKIILDTVDKPHTPLARVRPAVSFGSSSMVERCLQKDPGKRYASASELLQELERRLKDAQSEAKRSGQGRSKRPQAPTCASQAQAPSPLQEKPDGAEPVRKFAVGGVADLSQLSNIPRAEAPGSGQPASDDADGLMSAGGAEADEETKKSAKGLYLVAFILGMSAAYWGLPYVNNLNDDHWLKNVGSTLSSQPAQTDEKDPDAQESGSPEATESPRDVPESLSEVKAALEKESFPGKESRGTVPVSVNAKHLLATGFSLDPGNKEFRNLLDALATTEQLDVLEDAKDLVNDGNVNTDQRAELMYSAGLRALAGRYPKRATIFLEEAQSEWARLKPSAGNNRWVSCHQALVMANVLDGMLEKALNGLSSIEQMQLDGGAEESDVWNTKVQRGWIYVKQGRLDSAIELAQGGLKRFSSSSIVAPLTQSRLHHLLGVGLMESRNLKIATQQFRFGLRSLEQVKGGELVVSAAIWSDLSVVYARNGKFSEAEEMEKKALALDKKTRSTTRLELFELLERLGGLRLSDR